MTCPARITALKQTACPCLPAVECVGKPQPYLDCDGCLKYDPMQLLRHQVATQQVDACISRNKSQYVADDDGCSSWCANPHGDRVVSNGGRFNFLNLTVVTRGCESTRCGGYYDPKDYQIRKTVPILFPSSRLY